MIENLELLHPVKRSKIKKGVEFIRDENQNKNVIQKAIVFGSAATSDCTNNSDIDLCLVSDYTTKNPTFFRIFGGLPLVMDDSCDIVIWNRIPEKLRDEISKKGVVVYES